MGDEVLGGVAWVLRRLDKGRTQNAKLPGWLAGGVGARNGCGAGSRAMARQLLGMFCCCPSRATFPFQRPSPPAPQLAQRAKRAPLAAPPAAGSGQLGAEGFIMGTLYTAFGLVVAFFCSGVSVYKGR